jgi:hypothetical protein
MPVLPGGRELCGAWENRLPACSGHGQGCQTYLKYYDLQILFGRKDMYKMSYYSQKFF